MIDLVGDAVIPYPKPNEATQLPATGLVITSSLLTRCVREHRHLPWLEDYLTWLEGKEADREYCAWLGQVAPWWNVKM